MAKIYIHPLKCGKSLSIEAVDCGPRGPLTGPIKDRGFMVATPDFDAVDLRGKHPRLVLVTITWVGYGSWQLSGQWIDLVLIFIHK